MEEQEICFFCKDETREVEFNERDGVFVCLGCYIKNYISEDEDDE